MASRDVFLLTVQCAAQVTAAEYDTHSCMLMFTIRTHLWHNRMCCVLLFLFQPPFPHA